MADERRAGSVRRPAAVPVNIHEAMRAHGAIVAEMPPDLTQLYQLAAKSEEIQ
jgi:hypothetical protein